MLTVRDDMNEVADKLIAVVAEEAEHCERMLVLLRHQQRRLVEGDAKGIVANAREQERAIRRGRELERLRLGLLDQLSQYEEFNGQRPDIDHLICVLSGDYGRKLVQLRQSLSGAMERMLKVKEQNTMLIERSMFNIGETMRLLAAVPGMDDTTGTGRLAMPVSVDRVG